jgi:cytochrome c biogenesis protein CcdA/glutaredoxin
MKRWAVLVLFIALLSVSVIAHEDFNSENPASDHVDLYMFYSSGCPYCAKMHTFLDGLQQEETKLTVYEYELKENLDLFFELAEKYGLELERSVRVPVVFIHEKVLVGFNEDIAETIESYVQECINEICEDPNGDATQTIGPTDTFNPTEQLQRLTIPAVIAAAAVDAINPCAFAVLIILLTTILATKSRKKALLAGIAFSSSIYIAYFLMGLGLFSAIQAAGATRLIYSIVAVLAIVVGLFNLKDYLWYGKWFKMEVPDKWRPKMKMLLKSVTSVPGAFLIGFLISLFLLPCTSGPYIVILGLLAHATTRSYAILMLLLYNLVFIIPMLIITGSIYFGFTTTEKAERWRTRRLKVLHLIAGVLILAIGIFMVASILLGYV